jgi:hypothetical protein
MTYCNARSRYRPSITANVRAGPSRRWPAWARCLVVAAQAAAASRAGMAHSADGRRLCADRGYLCFWRDSGSVRLGGSSEPRIGQISTKEWVLPLIEPQCPDPRSRAANLTIVREAATFSSPTRWVSSHRDGRSVSSIVPEMEAPAPVPPPGSGRGFLFGASACDESASHHRRRLNARGRIQ